MTGVWLYIDGLAYKSCRVEAGVEVNPSDFLKKPDEAAYFTKDTQYDTSVPGEYVIKVKSGWFTHKCRLIVEDTTPPAAVAVSRTVSMGGSCEPADLIAELSDATAVTAAWGTVPDFTRTGVQTVTVVLTDLGGNATTLQAELIVSRAVDLVVMEAGGRLPELSEFLLTNEEASFVTDMEKLDLNSVGDYAVQLIVGGEICNSVLRVEDTVAPQLEVHDLEGFCMAKREAIEFVTNVTDATEVTVSFKQEPDWSLEGPQEVDLLACDAGGNQVAKTAVLTLFADTEAPVISGAADINIYLGDSVSYRKNITVTDNSQVEPELTVDTSGVNLDEAGVYPVIYIARDNVGNTASVTVNLTVTARMYSQEEVDAMADEVLAKIITDGMTQREKAEAIYTWITTHVSYISHSEGDDWVRSAYEGLKQRQGDCRVYAATSKELLTRAGITNMDIAKIPAKSNHYWNLVDVGEGWLHFDTTPRKGGPRGFFLWTDSELMEYSKSHSNSHNYDHDAYPQVN